MAEPDGLLLLDFALRGAAVALLLLLAGLLLRGHPGSQAARLAAFLSLGVAAYAVCAAPGIAPLRAWWHGLLLALASGNAFVFWLMARALFDDGFRLRGWHAIGWAAFAVGAPVDFYIFDGAARAGVQPLGLILALGRVACAVAALLPALLSWQADLVEERRRLRGFIVAAIALHVLVDVVATSVVPIGSSVLAGALNAAGLLLITLVIAWPLLRIADGDLFTLPALATGEAAVPAPAPQPDPAEAKLVDALHRLMTVERVQRSEGLTIGALALKLGLPEYRLRRLINQSLGYRNFNAFVNFHRIEEAKLALADPAQAEVPVLTIALDSGFQSLGPFNRAFKAETGLTPTDYRRLHLTGRKSLETSKNFEIGKPG